MRAILQPAAIAAMVSLALPCAAQIPTGPYTVETSTVASGLSTPVQLKAPPDGSTRLFVVDQVGQIRVIENGVLLDAPFLDVSGLLVPLFAPYDERGLLGLAFHPDFATNGRFFIHYSRSRSPNPGDPCASPPFGCNSEVIAEYTVTPPSSNVANPTGTVLFVADKPQFNHNAGAIDFGPDGYLYFGLGDGGGANDGLADNPPSHGPTGNAQNLGVPLGKMHRFDTSTPGVLAVPADNPFVDTQGALPSIFAYGLRNPYSFSFDSFGAEATGALIVGDVGQDAFEEIDIISVGQNMGWPIREAFHCFDAFHTTTPPADCRSSGLTPPVLEYSHLDADGTFQGIAVVGGYVYRGGAFPGLQGQYIFGDFSTDFSTPDGHLFLADMNSGPGTPGPMQRLILGSSNRTFGHYLKGFGRDAAGDIYVLASDELGPTGTTGLVLKIIRCPADFNADGIINADDLGDFITGYFNDPPDVRCDFNADGVTNADDLGDYITAYFNGC